MPSKHEHKVGNKFYPHTLFPLTPLIFKNFVYTFAMAESNYTFTGDVNAPVLAAVFTIEFIAGLVLNIVVITVTILKKTWKKQGTIFFTSLALANLFMVIFNIPFQTIGIATREWVFGSTEEQKRKTCLFAAFTMWYSTITILLTLAAVSFDRFLFIVKPRIHKRFMRPRVTAILTIFIWLLAAVMTSTPFYGFGEFEYEPVYGSCLARWKGTGFVVYFAIIFLSIITVITVTSVWMFCFTRTFIKVHPEVEQPPDPSIIYVSKKNRLLGIFGSMLLTYSICFLSIASTSLLSLITAMPDAVFFVNIIAFYFVTIATPLIQSYFRPDIKEQLLLCYRKIAKY